MVAVTPIASTRILTATSGTAYDLERVELNHEHGAYTNLFALKNNKSLGETLKHRRYAKLSKEAERFSAFMDAPLGEFLLSLKLDGELFYRLFLNKHGDKTYSTFSIQDQDVLMSKGIYAYYVGDQLKYIGRCRDFMKKRINQGYGKIHPKNCYLDGQSTNCHLNAKITEAGKTANLWFCALKSDDEIWSAETQLIRRYSPEWNVQKH